MCDCGPTQVVEQCTEHEREPNDEEDDTVLARSQRVAEAAVDQARIDAQPDETASDATPSYRQLERGKAEEREPQRDPLEQIDPTVESAQIAEDELDAVASEYGVDVPDGDVSVFTGNFAATEEGEELVIIEAARKLSVYTPDRRVAELDLDGEPAADDFEELGIEPDHIAPRAVQLVQDETVQVLVHWREENDEGEVAYKVGVYKPIGEFVGRIFERTLATRADEDGELHRKGMYEVLRGDDHRFLRWIPADDEGQLLTGEAETLEWNKWEGVYRVPKPPPTAPEPEKLQSFLYPPLVN